VYNSGPVITGWKTVTGHQSAPENQFSIRSFITGHPKPELVIHFLETRL